MLTDPVADYLTRIRNGLSAEHEDVEIPSSKLKREMSRILKEQGYIADFEVAEGEAPAAEGAEKPSEGGGEAEDKEQTSGKEGN